MSILDGAPGFILLGFIMALAAYLRQVSTGAQKMIDELQGGMPTGFPYSQATPAVRSERMESLLGMRGKLVAVTHVLFFMLVLLAGRMIFSTWSARAAANSNASAVALQRSSLPVISRSRIASAPAVPPGSRVMITVKPRAVS